MTAILKQFQATPPPASVKAVEEICVTCGGAHPYYQRLATDGNTFLELRDNIQGYVSVVVINYNQGNSGYRPSGVANQIRPPESSYQAPIQQNQVVPLSELEKIKNMNEINMKSMQTQINNMKNELRNEMKTLIQASMSNQTNELKNIMASFFQMNIASTLGLRPLPSNTIGNSKGELKSITTRSDIVLDGTSVPMPPSFINPKENERVKETLTDPDLDKFTIQQLHINITLANALILIPKYLKMLKALLYNKEKLLELANTPLNENCLVVILKKLPKKVRDPGKFLILCGFSELKCKALADLGASINLMPLYVWKKLGLPEFISTRMTLELANRAICTPAGIARDVFVLVGKFTFPADFVIVDYGSDPRVPLILGRTFLLTARALIDVYGEEMILCDEVKDDIFDSEGGNVLIVKLLNLDSTKDLHPPHNINPLSGSTTSSSNHLLEEFTDELALITFPTGNDDLPFDIKSDLREIEYFLNHDPTKEMDSILEDSSNESNLYNPNNNHVDTIPEMFTNEHALDYSSPPIYDEYDDDLFELESETNDAYNDTFNSNGEKIKESKLLIDELDLPR
nr:hypothetical protein [Tanacetum cinerariifolium]